MVYGPREFVPAIELEIIEKRAAIPLDKNEGIYIRDIKSGIVRSVIGETYLLKPNEVLWEKELPLSVEKLLHRQKLGKNYFAKDENESDENDFKRDKTRVVSFRVPHNSATQVFDYKTKRSRTVFGPSLILLEPDEIFTVLSLSGGKPKRPGMINSLCMRLGPDFMTDIVTVETSDHARLSLTLSYNWQFEL